MFVLETLKTNTNNTAGAKRFWIELSYYYYYYYYYYYCYCYTPTTTTITT